MAYCTQLFNLDKLETPTPVSTYVAQSQIVILSCFCVCLAAIFAGTEGVTKSNAFVPVVVIMSCMIGKAAKWINVNILKNLTNFLQ